MASSIYATRIVNNATSEDEIEDYINEYQKIIFPGWKILIGIKSPNSGSYSKYVQIQTLEGTETCEYMDLDDLPTKDRLDIAGLHLNEAIKDIPSADDETIAKITVLYK